TQPDRDWRYIGVVLPIQFVDFSGLVQNENSLLKWTISTTKAIDHFEIERSTDNIRFTKVGNLKTTVLLNQEQRFNFTDDISTVHTNIIFYRLKVIGSAGEFKYSQIIVLKKTVTQYNISLFPNPAKEFVTIQFMAGNETIVELGIWDNFGKLLQQQKQKVNTGSNSIQLNGLSKYPAGIYILKMITDNKVIANRFLISK
ncbi:MAG: T9SS type A sorting domain-containing protein, partial [Chitinophagaceae bacterium]